MRKTASLRSAATGTFFAAVLSMSLIVSALTVLTRWTAFAAVFLSSGLLAQTAVPPAKADASILITNVRIFDGIGDNLRPGNLLIIGGTIKRISASQIQPPPNTHVIDGGGRVLMPGLTDAHWHMTMAAATPADRQQADTGLMYVQNLRFP